MTFAASKDLAALDEWLGGLGAIAAVYRIRASAGAPILSRTTNLQRRLQRLLGPAREASKRLHLRGVEARIEIWPTPNRLAQWIGYYLAARATFPQTYLREIRLRQPPFLKLILSNPYPRTQVTTSVQGARSLFFGPFRTRVSAELFESRLLDLFQIRRCTEDLEPSPDHPGCLYGEIGRCPRPCQGAIPAAAYRDEVRRLGGFLETGGTSLLDPARAQRDLASASLQFEAAQEWHQRIEQMEKVLAVRDPLAAAIERHFGYAVVPGDGTVDRAEVEIWPMREGLWHGPVRFRPVAGSTFEQQLREAWPADAEPLEGSAPEHLALLGRWHDSALCDGDWVASAPGVGPPWRKLANAARRLLSSPPSSASPDQTVLPTAFPEG
jgi:hypothetical protein